MRTWWRVGVVLWAFVPFCGCHLISGLSDLSVGAGGSQGGGGAGGEGATTTTSSATTTTSTDVGGGGSGGSGGGGSGGGTAGSGGTTTTSNTMCSDSTKNGSETDVDCGGPDCEKRCALNAKCLVSADCESAICRNTRCEAAVRIAVGNAHACAVLSTQELFCWGENASGQLGVGDNMPRSQPTLVPLADVVDVATGGLPGNKDVAHTCALTTTGSVYCWGANDVGQLGIGSNDDQNSPAKVSLLNQVSALSLGGSFACAVDAAPNAFCWGDNSVAQLGVDVGLNALEPVLLDGLNAPSFVSAGTGHACAILNDGTVWCWGESSKGQVGNVMATSPAKPIQTSLIFDVTAVRSGHAATCALSSAGFFCFGDNADSQLSEAVLMPTATEPALLDIAGVSMFALGADGDVAAGNDAAGGHVCALVALGEVVCWGNNRSGQLGRGTKTPFEKKPVKVAQLGAANRVALGAEVACATLIDGSLKCWGRNDRGQLGVGEIGGTQSNPVPVAWP